MKKGDPVDPLGQTVPSEAPIDPEEEDARLGAVFSGYRLVRRIGRGGMASVYRAERLSLGQFAAVKVIAGELARDPKTLQRFRAEALAVTRLHHPNIVEIYEIGDDPEPHSVMELLEGLDLAALLTAEGGLAEGRSLSIALQVLDVLGVVHGQGIIHRDIKPENIFVLDGDRVKLLDFGIAKIRDGQELGLSSSTGNALMGTPLYMSPEQIEGRASDARTDLYSFGLVLYEMLTGRPVFSGGSVASLLSQQLHEVPPPVRAARPDASPRIEAVLMRCLAKRPEDRFANAAEAVSALLQA